MGENVHVKCQICSSLVGFIISSDNPCLMIKICAHAYIINIYTGIHMHTLLTHEYVWLADQIDVWFL